MTLEGWAALMQGAELLDPVELLERPPWHADARCLEFPGVDFYPPRGQDTRPAKAVCGGCAVRDECLDFALEHRDHFGVWGGKSERERRAIRIARNRDRRESPMGDVEAA